MAAFDYSNERCLRIGSKPILRWPGAPASLSNATVWPPPIAHLAFSGKALFISGRVGRVVGHDPIYWNVETGQVGKVEYSDAIYVSAWEIGVLGADGKFHQLAVVPPLPK
jgi:hypothetical protein